MAENDVQSALSIYPGAEPLIQGIYVDGLFGRHSYDVELPSASQPRLLLIHGENGTGKTTLLRLVWNLLSPSDRRGHRTHLAKTPFRKLSVELADAHNISVKKRDGLLGAYEVELSVPGAPDVHALYDVDDQMVVRRNDYAVGAETLIETNFTGSDSRSATVQAMLRESLQGRFEDERGRARFMAYLNEASINPLLLADDRSLYADDPELERMREQAYEREVVQSGRRLARPSRRQRDRAAALREAAEVRPRADEAALRSIRRHVQGPAAHEHLRANLVIGRRSSGKPVFIPAAVTAKEPNHLQIRAAAGLAELEHEVPADNNELDISIQVQGNNVLRTFRVAFPGAKPSWRPYATVHGSLSLKHL